ncbi:MAG: hypothetical protein NC485_10610 [Ruminococcus flavefaciens]|nr:hypothetical protein [Ruminococcus flavefaciens]MCM1061104.1 hypothetical protein [Eubacterium sp.]
MYRIAVIQNEVEMQHSGYVDSIPKYKRQNFDLQEHVFNRFSSVNIRELFVEGENYLLDYDCLIIGTNATSDGDVYSILCNEANKAVLAEYISLGKGLLICSQKKFKEVKTPNNNRYKARETYFLPEVYEYMVVSRPKEESSADGSISIFYDNQNNIQKILTTYPQNITDEIIDDHCKKNDFQRHYYRDYIIPLNDSSYFSVLADLRDPYRNTLMVACPQRNEKIVISTMALDWAGHYELIENILYYLIVGIPNVAFVNKENSPSLEFEFIISEAKLSKISYISYKSLRDVVNDTNLLRKYHTLYVFSPDFTEDEVANFWESYVKPQDGYVKLFYYKYINKELVLVNFSYYSYIDTQKREVETWLRCKYNGGLWDNSFWKTYDVIFALHNMGVSISCFLKSVFLQIQTHYQKGSYDGVLAPTCGLLELEALVLSNETYRNEITKIEDYYIETKNWLIKKYNDTSGYNKKFIIRSFYNCGRFDDLSKAISDFKTDLQNIATSGTVQDKLEIDLCLDIEVCLVYLDAFAERKDIRNHIHECILKILETQMQNGRWDNNCGKTARLLVFLLKYQAKHEFEKDEEIVQEAIDRGITALRNAYQVNNWEDNIVTTANAITAIIAADRTTTYESKDFLNQVSKEAKLVDSYNSLLLALKTIDFLTKKNGESIQQLLELKNIKTQFDNSQSKLRIATVIASVSILLVLSYYLFLYLKNPDLFKDMILESFMWIPIAVGILITGVIEFIPKLITSKREKKK